MRLLSSLALLVLLLLPSPSPAAGRAMTVDDLLAVKGVSDPQVSPDGKWVVYVVSELDRESGKSNSDLWLVAVAGGESKRLTTAAGADNHPRWGPDGKTIAFISSRGGSSQVWLLPLDGGEARQLTKLPIDVAGPIWSPKGDRIAFAAEVYPGKTPEETAAKDKEKAESKSKARIYDRLMIRHWDRWDEGKRSHLFVCDAKTGEAKDLTPKLEGNTPPAPFGGSNEYAFSPDGKELAFTAEPLKDEAWSTNSDIWTVPVEGGELRNMTVANLGADAQPAYSPGGRLLSYVSQRRPGFEADQWVLKFGDRISGRVQDVTSSHLDRSVLSYVWSQSGEGKKDRPGKVLAVIDSEGTEPVVAMSYDIDDEGLVVIPAQPDTLLRGGVNTAVQPSLRGGPLVYLHADSSHPAEVYTAGAAGSDPVALTHHNDRLVAELDLPKTESFTFPGADGDKVQGWLLRPPGFDPKQKYPVVFLIHGGPQGAWHDEWHGRWNYQMFGAPGYAVVAINPRGSTGFGQGFTDQISQDWTGKVYEDLKKGLDYALQAYPFLDGDRVAAAGGSYGGFMVNWMAGHTDRFKCLISHAGVFDLTSKYGTTEELWFPEWEFGGTPWDKPEHYRERSPSAFVQNFKTPTLVIHGALDFRVPDAQGLGMFTALQRRGVPSRYVFFPDEGHWILKPANRVLWWREVHEWLAKYLKNK
ncbi:MAG: S9 family peptidase [Isosphaeraceae bacterium]|nr:S9 family peptidase [Isosphaeraceae bacterium]